MKKRRGKLGMVIVLTLFLISGYFVVGAFKPSGPALVVLSSDLNRIELARTLGETLGWNDREKSVFAATWAEMQWLAFSKHIPQIFEERYKWGEGGREALLVNSSRYIDPKYDLLRSVYVPETYVISGNETPAGIAKKLIDPVLATSTASFLRAHIDIEVVQNIAALVRTETENLPDLVPLPPADLQIEFTETDQVLLRFSTTYYNQGKGPLELFADPKTRGIRSDIERDVFQRIYKKDGTERTRISGTFMWHQEHLHYHFADFAIYDLDSIETDGPTPDLSGSRQKSTFCIRDVSKTDLSLPNYAEKAGYLICGKEKQGISVGWGDTYYYTYPDQLLNVTDLPSGTYKLMFVINPFDRFDEGDMSNNTASATFRLDMQKRTVTMISMEPKTFPKVEHIYPDECGVTITC